jgi:hypothetical protein
LNVVYNENSIIIIIIYLKIYIGMCLYIVYINFIFMKKKGNNCVIYTFGITKMVQAIQQQQLKKKREEKE